MCVSGFVLPQKPTLRQRLNCREFIGTEARHTIRQWGEDRGRQPVRSTVVHRVLLWTAEA
jgi:hypothetical protein